MSGPGPLSGVRVVDVTTTLAGPWGTLVLADQGADVIKIEAPGGDALRQIGPSRNGMSTFFANVNRNKRSIVLDLGNDVGREVVHRLLRDADVFVQNLKVGAAERLGIGAEQLRAEFPRLVYASINGFGSGTSRSGDPAYDHIVQAMSGIAARQADRDGPPDLVRQGIVDKTTALMTAQAITAALFRRERTGHGETIEVAMLDAAVAFLWPDGMTNHSSLEPDISSYNDIAGSYRLTPTSDGHIVLNVLTTRQFMGLMEATGVEVDERMRDPQHRGRHGGPLMREARTRLGTLSTAEVVERLQRHGVPCGPVVGLAELATSAAVRETGVVREVEHPQLGRLLDARPAPRIEGIEDVPWRPAPALGAHTDEILAEAGYTGPEVAELRATGAVA